MFISVERKALGESHNMRAGQPEACRNNRKRYSPITFTRTRFFRIPSNSP